MEAYYKYVLVKIMTQNKFYNIKKLDTIKGKKLHFVVKENLEAKNIRLQQRVHDLEYTTLTVIELLKKGNNEKALKLLKKVMYE